MELTEILQYFYQHNGYLTYQNIAGYNIPYRYLNQLIEEGKVYRIKQGFYKLTNLEETRETQYTELHLMIPKGIICLISALSYYHLTTSNPAGIDIAIPNDQKKSCIDYPPVHFHYFRNQSYETGITDIKEGTIHFRIYNREKTLCDAFRNINYVTEEIAIEALNEYVRLPDRNLNLLMNYAQKLKIGRSMENYLKVLVN